MKRIYLITAVILALLITACKKSSSPADENPPVTQTPAVTEIGTPDGLLITKTIGTAGGTIVSADGNMELIIPAGALATNTTITIQPLINNCPNGLGKAYRCLPDGLQFTKDITLKIHYTDAQLEATKAEYMGLVFQDAQRHWQVVKNVTNDAITKVLSATINHFTDFTAFDMLDLAPPTRYMQPGESGSFKLHSIGAIGGDQANTLLTILSRTPPVWKVNGETGGNSTLGTIAPVPGQEWIEATYKAPATAPQGNTVTISAELNIPFVINGQSFNRGILTAKVIFGEYKFSLFFELTDISPCNYSGQTQYDVTTMNIQVTGNTVSVSNIINQAPTAITPNIISVGPTPDIQCQVSATPGAKGFLNITKVTGEVVNNGGGRKKLLLTFLNSGSDNNKCVVTCPGLPPTVQPSTVAPDYDLSVDFILKDSTQSQGNQPGLFWKLTSVP